MFSRSIPSLWRVSNRGPQIGNKCEKIRIKKTRIFVDLTAISVILKIRVSLNISYLPKSHCHLTFRSHWRDRIIGFHLDLEVIRKHRLVGPVSLETLRGCHVSTIRISTFACGFAAVMGILFAG